MPKTKRNRRGRRRPEPEAFGIRSCAVSLLRVVGPFLRRARLPRTRSAQHMRNATIEVLEAMRAVLGEAIEWLRETKSDELKRIRVEG
jgi:hypothetical protein